MSPLCFHRGSIHAHHKFSGLNRQCQRCLQILPKNGSFIQPVFPDGCDQTDGSTLPGQSSETQATEPSSSSPSLDQITSTTSTSGHPHTAIAGSACDDLPLFAHIYK